MYRIFLSLLLISVTYAQTDYTSCRSKINTLLQSDFFQSSGISVSIFDLTEHQAVFEKDIKKLLLPGSNMKILTSAAGLLFLGTDYTFNTTMYYNGSILNNTLYGDLYIKGGLDPDFVTADLDSLIKPLSDSGITQVTGKIFLDKSAKDSLFWGSGWMWDDDPSTDAPYLSALNINDNAVKFFLIPGDSGAPVLVNTDPPTNYIKVINESSTDTDSLNTAEVTRDWINRTNTFHIRGSVPGTDTTAVILNIWDPEHYFGTLFIERLNASGIRVNDSIEFSIIPEQAVKFSELKRPYSSVIYNMNKVSDNLSAEMVLLALAYKYYGAPATAKNGFKLIDSLVYLAGNDPRAYVFADGSGVSHYNLLSTEMINSILKYFYYQRTDLYPVLYNSFPVAGVDGTLSRRMKSSTAENNVHAKTGTVSGVASLSGYLTAANGHKISFSIMIQNYRGSASTARQFQDEICKILTSRSDIQ